MLKALMLLCIELCKLTICIGNIYCHLKSTKMFYYNEISQIHDFCF